MDFRDRVRVTRTTGGDGDPWGGGGTPFDETKRCRIDYSSRLVRDQQGAEVMSTVHIRFPRNAGITYTDEITWKDADGIEKTARPVAIQVIKDLDYRTRMTVVDL